MALTSAGYFRQRLTDESMSPDIVLLGTFLSLAAAVMKFARARALVLENTYVVKIIRYSR